MVSLKSLSLPRNLQSIERATLLLGATTVILLLLLWHLLPVLFWSYHLHRAGEQLARGLVWPAERQVDSLPRVDDAEALDRARHHLAAAAGWRPADAHAYRLAGRLYAAHGDRLHAARMLERARSLAPHHPLIALESYLVQEELLAVIEGAPQRSLVAAFAGGRLEVPAGQPDTPYCRRGKPVSCYIAETAFALPYAPLAGEEAVEHPTLFLHAPARVRHSLELPRGQPGLFFLHGQDPRAHDRGSDGATFQVWVEPQEGETVLLYETEMGGEQARRGWMPGTVDLSRWAGETVTLMLVTTPGTAGDTTADWYGWGALRLTTNRAARYATMLPGARIPELFIPGVVDADALLRRAIQAEKAGRMEEAQRWHARAALAGRLDPPD